MVEKLKKNNKLLIPIIIGVVLVLIGVTYAWMTNVLSGTKINKITVGALSLVLDDETSNGINIEQGLPQSDTDGLTNTEYTFSVENNGASNAKYNIYLEDEELESGEVRMNDSNVKIYLVKNNEESEVKLLSSIVKEERRVLDENIIIEPGNINNYSLRLWIDGDSSQSEVGGKVFKAKVKLEAIQTEESNGVYNLNGYVYDSSDNVITNGVVVAYSEPKYGDIDSEGHFNIFGLESGTHTLYYVPNKTIEEIKSLSQKEIEQISGVGKVSINTKNNDSTISLNNGNKIKRSALKKLEVGDTFTYAYTGEENVFVTPEEGNYKIELWGAQGGDKDLATNVNYGKSAYTTGIVGLNLNTKLYLYVGQKGSNNHMDSYNGGGHGGYGCNPNNSSGDVCYRTPEKQINYTQYFGNSGGGATDVRVINGDWNDENSLRSRIMVAGGGGGRQSYESAGDGNYAGGLIGYNSTYYAGHGDMGWKGYGGTQVSGGSGGGNTDGSSVQLSANGSFGKGGNSDTVSSGSGASGGGGGWYGGGAGGRTINGGPGHPGAGGSSYISGHTGCVAVTSKTDTTPKSGCTTGTTDNTCSISPYEYSFTETKMIDGAGYSWTNVKGSQEAMPNPTGGYYDLGVGHTGNGFVRITYLGK